MFEGKIRAKVAEMFPFMKPENVSEHYKMIEQVLEDEKMVSLRTFSFPLFVCLTVSKTRDSEIYVFIYFTSETHCC